MNYWLSPKGKVFTCELGKHFELSIDICERIYKHECLEHGILDKHMIPCLQSGKTPLDFLEDHNWIRYEDWNGCGWIIRHQRPTKKQIETMFELTGYFYNKEQI